MEQGTASQKVVYTYSELLNSPAFAIAAGAVVLVLIAIGILIWRKTEKKKIWYTLLIFFIVMLLRSSVLFFGVIKTETVQPDEAAPEGTVDLVTTDMNGVEKVLDSFVHALQTFSLDEDYTQYLLEGKRILVNSNLPRWAEVYGIVVSVLNVAAPLIGGAIILELLTEVFPSIILWLHPFRRKFVFSELNESSICLAEDIFRGKYRELMQPGERTMRPLIVFTDTYMDDNSEVSSELKSRAKAIKAVCVKTDLTELSFARSKFVTYFLIDDNITDNITSFTQLMNREEIRPRIDKELKQFRLRAVLQGEYKLKKAAADNVRFKVKSVNVQGGEETVLDAAGKAVSAEEFRKFCQRDKFAVAYDTQKPDAPKTMIDITFDCSSRPLDRTCPFTIAVENLEELLEYDHGAPRKTVDADYITEIVQKPLKTRICLFIQDEYQSEIAYRIYNSADKYASKVIFRNVRDYKNTAINLMADVPLFLLLLEKPGAKTGVGMDAKDVPVWKDLYVTILGGGCIAREVFKAVYWCGQMLNVRLHVNVLTEAPDQFKQEINKSCPELLASCKKYAELLRTYPYDLEKPLNPPYIHELNIEKVEDARFLDTYPKNVLEKTHYYVLALGSDETAAETTKILSDRLAKMALLNHCPKQRIIVPAIFNPKLAEAVTIRIPDESGNESRVIPFAVLDQRFSFDNVFMLKHRDAAKATAKIYDEHKIKLPEDEYKYWANLAKIIHVDYKLFSFDLLELTDAQPTGAAGYGDKLFCVKPGATFEDVKEPDQGWIEKRRWNAFMRAEGFCCPTEEEFEAYFKATGNYKNMAQKYHPCLVERDYKTEQLPDSESFNKQVYDMLDYVSMTVHHKQVDAGIVKNKKKYGADLIASDFKQWDDKTQDSGLMNTLAFGKSKKP